MSITLKLCLFLIRLQFDTVKEEDVEKVWSHIREERKHEWSYLGVEDWRRGRRVGSWILRKCSEGWIHSLFFFSSRQKNGDERKKAMEKQTSWSCPKIELKFHAESQNWNIVQKMGGYNCKKMKWVTHQVGCYFTKCNKSKLFNSSGDKTLRFV